MPDAALVTVKPDGWVPADFSEATIDQTWHWGTAVADRVLRVMLRDLLSESTDATQAAPRQTALTVLKSAAAIRGGSSGSVNKQIQTSLSSPDPNLVAAALNVANAEQAAPRVLARIVTTGAEAYCAAVRDGGATLDAQGVIRAALVIEVLTHAFTADEPSVAPRTVRLLPVRARHRQPDGQSSGSGQSTGHTQVRCLEALGSQLDISPPSAVRNGETRTGPGGAWTASAISSSCSRSSVR